MIKKHIEHRFISIITALAITFSGLMLFNPLRAYASNDTNKEYYDEALVTELNNIEPIKDQYGLKGVDFCNLFTSEKIPMYEYTENGIVKMGQVLPVYYQNVMKLIMFEVNDNRYQATAIPNDMTVNNENLAIVYDNTGCYFYNGDSFILLFKSSLRLANRNHITTLPDSEKQKIKTTNVTNKMRINYYTQSRPTNVILNVTFVPQPSGSNICWAAVTAMIVNYIKHTNYSATYIAYMQFGSDYDHGLNPSDVADYMNDFFSLGYTYHNSPASINRICTNINNSKPIYGSFYYYKNSSNWGYHASLIYGYNIINDTIFIKDPESGSVSGYQTSSGVSYYSAAAGVTLSLSKTVCKYW